MDLDTSPNQRQRIIDKLRDDENYYGEFGSKFLSNSNIKTLFENPLALREPTEKTVAMVMGGYLHTVILEPNKIDKFKIVEASTRNTKAYKEISQGEIVLLQHEVDILHELKDVIMRNNLCNSLIRGDREGASIEYEVPAVMEHNGLWWKGKADVLNHDEGLIVDVKSTSSLDTFRFSADRYNYDSQAFLYKKLFGYDFIFVVADKTTKKIAIFECSQAFLDRGERKVEKASDIYELYYKTPDFDPYQYIEMLTL
ncbi:MAG: PD-(D/E)XK nuclease-like domain-containing protein [candidate division WOR-3 bacterium]|nr:PD-(D/E)XK nuclease-like domain-containing protein [candidate division WOR-3 bacterium]